ACFEQALVCLRQLPEDRGTAEQTIDVQFDLRHSLVQIGELGRVLEHLRDADRLATAFGDRRRRGWVADYLSNYSWNTGEHERAIESARKALGIAGDLDDFGLRVAATFHLGMAHYALGKLRSAVDLLRKNVDALTGDLVRERFGLAVPPAVLSRAWLV